MTPDEAQSAHACCKVNCPEIKALIDRANAAEEMIFEYREKAAEYKESANAHRDAQMRAEKALADHIGEVNEMVKALEERDIVRVTALANLHSVCDENAAKIASLTAERDEAREKYRLQTESVREWEATAERLTSERDGLRSERARKCQRCEAVPADNTCHDCYMKESRRGDMWQARTEAAESESKRLTAELEAAKQGVIDNGEPCYAHLSCPEVQRLHQKLDECGESMDWGKAEIERLTASIAENDALLRKVLPVLEGGDEKEPALAAEIRKALSQEPHMPCCLCPDQHYPECPRSKKPLAGREKNTK